MLLPCLIGHIMCHGFVTITHFYFELMLSSGLLKLETIIRSPTLRSPSVEQVDFGMKKWCGRQLYSIKRSNVFGLQYWQAVMLRHGDSVLNVVKCCHRPGISPRFLVMFWFTFIEKMVLRNVLTSRQGPYITKCPWCAWQMGNEYWLMKHWTVS